jgi:alpha-tubulin suppressor-like RCC1 family protein
MLGIGDTISRSFPIQIKSLHQIEDIGGGCFQSIAVNTKGKIFTFGDNPTGQQGIGTYGRCHVPQLMPLRITGKLKSADPKFQPPNNSGFILKVLKYVLFSVSILLNIFLFRKYKSKTKI